MTGNSPGETTVEVVPFNVNGNDMALGEGAREAREGDCVKGGGKKGSARVMMMPGPP